MPWVHCVVTKAGPAENGVTYVSLKANDGSFHRWFKAEPGIKKEILATALTAISSDKGVQAFLTTTEKHGTINRLFVKR